MVLKRKIYDQLLKWKSDYTPEYALFLKGARRVGKTTIAEEFGRKEYKSFITINFQEANDTIRDLFVNSLLDLDYFFNVIQMQYRKTLYKRESLIILDEIQLYPLARQALKSLLKDGRYDYIETGSLAGITKKTRKMEILIPSEEYAVEMFPLDFEEFLWAGGDTFTMEVIREHVSKLQPLESLHKDLMRRFREYMCVGGMPQAVAAYAETKDFEKVIKKHDVLAVLAQRKTRRSYTDESMTQDELAFLLWAAMGVREGEDDMKKKRQVPSGGGRYPLELYVFVNRVDGLARGLYHYLALSHELEFVKPLEEQEERITEAVRGKKFVGHAPLFFIWTAIPYRGEWHSGTRAMKPILLDAGHSCQNLYIACEAIGCGMCPVGSYLQADTDRLLCLHHGAAPSELDEYVIYGAALGKINSHAGQPATSCK